MKVIQIIKKHVKCVKMYLIYIKKQSINLLNILVDFRQINYFRIEKKKKKRFKYIFT